MKTNIILGVSVITCLLVILSACGNELDDSLSKNHSKTKAVSKSIGNSSEDNQSESTNKRNENNNGTKAVISENADQNTKANLESKSNESNTKRISSGTSAIEYLRHQLKMDDNDDIHFDDLGGELITDQEGSYYMVELISESLQKNGGSGTVGLYKVYEDGTWAMAK